MTRKANDGEPSVQVHICRNAGELAEAAAAEIDRRARESIARRGRFCIALSGGSTPGRLYALMATRPTERESLPWERIQVFWGDERAVPPDDPQSNFRSANEVFLSKVSIPAGNVHRIKAEMPDPADAAALYEADLRAFFATPVGRFPRFDLVLLGLGADGHTASLFPGSDALDERVRLVLAPVVMKLGVQRITMTLPVLNNARAAMFLVSGANKAAALARVLEGDGRASALPATLVHPGRGALLWFADRDAARGLRGDSAEPGSQPRSNFTP
jgi:6-phosphogluconolactonase